MKVLTVSTQLTKGQRSLENGPPSSLSQPLSLWLLLPKATFFGGIPSIAGWSLKVMIFSLGALCGELERAGERNELYISTYFYDL